jgi:hypothetical protein
MFSLIFLSNMLKFYDSSAATALGPFIGAYPKLICVCESQTQNTKFVLTQEELRSILL